MQVHKYVFWLPFCELCKALEGNIQSFAVIRAIGVEDQESCMDQRKSGK